MSAPRILGKNQPITASMIRTALGDALSRIRAEDGLTWVEIGELLNKSDDQAAKYADGSAEMPVSTYYRAKGLWNGRFTGLADRLVGESCEPLTPHQTQSCVTRLSYELSLALEDGVLSKQELLAMRSTLERARDAIDAQLAKLKPECVA